MDFWRKKWCFVRTTCSTRSNWFISVPAENFGLNLLELINLFLETFSMFELNECGNKCDVIATKRLKISLRIQLTLKLIACKTYILNQKKFTRTNFWFNFTLICDQTTTITQQNKQIKSNKFDNIIYADSKFQWIV